MATTKRFYKAALGMLLLALLAGGVVLWRRGRESGGAVNAARGHRIEYRCPMHPQIVQDHPGFCPICHMRLEKVEDDGPDADAAVAAPVAGPKPKPIKYRSPMDPTLFSDHPMKDSMGMDYIPVYADQGQGNGGNENDGKGDVPGKAAFTLSPYRRQLIGVRTVAAAVRTLHATLRLPARAVGEREVEGQLLELDVDRLRPGMKARLLGPNGQRADARVVHIDEAEDGLTHSFGVTLRTGVPVRWLRPGLFCGVRVEADLGRHLAVPRDAILDTGQRQVLFVESGSGRFEPREVTLGESGDSWVAVKRGVRPGEQVVVAANFLIDSESRFQAALLQFGGKP